jgi:hypothetical protein
MIDDTRHVRLQPLPWREKDAAAAIEEIVSDAFARFDGERFWPAHPLDEGIRDSHTSLYFGATGVIWGITYLSSLGATKARFDFRPFLSPLIDASRAELSSYGGYARHGSFLIGDLGTALLIMRLAATPAIADLIHARASANTTLPIRELMWGMPGSMLACVHMSTMTDESRWKNLFTVQAGRLLDALEETADGPSWTQDLYGERLRYLGAVHGYAGNMIALIRGWRWLSDEQRARIADATTRTLVASAWCSEQGANWPATAGRGEKPQLCQHCHGAPGMVTTFAAAPFTSRVLEELLADGGKFTWAAGPLAKGSNLCHGTGGNGYAFLKLYRRTNDLMWLERARAFAMTAIAQCREARDRFSQGRYSLWTGDIGLAIYLWDCLTMEPRFPTIDVF